MNTNNPSVRNLNPVVASIGIALVAIPVVAVLVSHYFHEFVLVQYDDSFVTYRYARNFAEGNGLRFNPGDDSNSASSFLFVLLLGGLHFLTSIPIEFLATILNSLGLVVIVIISSLLVLQKSRSWLALVLAALLAISIVSCGPLLYWTFSGMETTFFLALLTVSIFVTLNKIGTKKSKVTLLLLTPLGLLAITRVEGLVCAVVLGSFCVLDDFKNRENLGLRKFLLPVAVPTGLFSAQLLFYKIYYGSAIADPIRFKDLVRYYHRSFGSAFDISRDFLFNSLQPFVLITSVGLLLFVIRTVKTRERQASHLLLPILFFCLFAFVLRSPHSDERRYELVFLVPLIFGCAITLRNIASIRSHKLKIIGAGISVVLSVIAIERGITESSNIAARTSTYMYVQKARAEAGKWLEANTPAGSRVVSADIGALSYFNPSNVFLDTPGLVNRRQLNEVLNGGDVYLTMREQRPDFLADTVGTDGVSAVESILSNPLGYYVESSQVRSSCPRLPVFEKELLFLTPERPTSILQIQVAKIKWKDCS